MNETNTTQNIGALQFKDKLDSLTLKTKKCWWYSGTVDKRDGRGRIRVGKKMKNVQTLAWEIANNEELEEGMQVTSSCENKLCVRPDHLEAERVTFAWRR